MPRMIYDYTKNILEKVSFNLAVLKKQLLKAFRNLLPYEIEQLCNWLKYFIKNKPDLQFCFRDAKLDKFIMFV